VGEWGAKDMPGRERTGEGKLQNKIIILNLGIYGSLKDRRVRTGFLVESEVQAKGDAAPSSTAEEARCTSTGTNLDSCAVEA
jgi:hypothetical protein